MSYGDGSIFELKKPDGKSYNPKKWRVCLSYLVEIRNEDGTISKKRKKIQRNIQGTKAEAKELRDKLSTEYDSNGNMLSSVEKEQQEAKEAEQMTLTKMIEIWHAARQTAGRASERTIREDRNRLKHIEKHIGNQPIMHINAQMIESTYAAIRADRGLCGTSMREIHTLLKGVFNKAIDYDLLVKNPCNYVDAPQRSDPKRNSLSEEEGRKLLAKIDEYEAGAYAALSEKEQRRQYREEHDIAKKRNAIRGIHDLGCIIAVRIGLATGMRRGEVFALSWQHVDFSKGTIKVCQAVTNRGVIKVPKTKAGIRTIAIDPVTTEHLAIWKECQAVELAKIGVTQTSETPICCSDIGGLYRIDNFEHWWSEWRKANGFEGLKFHELRHTQATMLLANKVDVKTVQTRMGHASASITLGWYAHAIPENDHEAANLLGNLFASKPVKGGEEASILESSQMSPECPPDAHLSEEMKEAS